MFFKKLSLHKNYRNEIMNTIIMENTINRILYRKQTFLSIVV